MPKNTAQRRIDSRRQNRATTISGTTISGGTGSGASAAMAGDGLSYDGVALNVGAGTLLTVGTDDVGITAGSTYQYVGTGSGTAAAWQNVSTLAGSGLTHSAGVLAVGAGSGITVNADDVALTTPGTLTASTSNSASGSHTHAVTTGAASTLTVATSNATGSSASLARADHLHTITSSADVTAGGTSLLASASGNLKLATGNIGTTLGYNGTFTSGFAGAGWRVDYGVTEAAKASAEFDNLTIRGRMRVYELLIQQIRATNGSVFVSSSSKVKTVTNTTNPLWTVNGSQLTFNGANATLTFTWCEIATADASDIDGGNDRQLYHGFLVGDVTRAQQVRWDGADFAGIIQSNLEVTSVGGLYEYGAALVSGDAPAVGYDYVRLGSVSDTTRQGTVYLTSDDSNAPFVDIVDGVTKHSDWNTAGKIRARLGKLSGITDAEWGTLSGYGLWSDNVYLTGSIYATDGIFNGTVYATAGSFSGTVTASAGSIGGWSIGATALTAGSGATTVGLDTGGTNPAIYAGSATPGSAPFRVTQAGALTASNATITGAITANSGSLAGFLTIGSSGGIYQGTGTAGTPTNGLKLFRSGDIGQIAIYDGGVKTMRITDDDLRMYLATYDGDYDDYRTIKWLPDIDGTDSGRTNFDYRSDITSWAAPADDVTLSLSTRVNAGDYNSRDANIVLAANNWNGSALNQTSIYIVQENSTTSYNSYIGLFSKYLYVTRNSAPSGTPSSGYCFVWVDSSTNTLKMKDSGGTTRSVTFS